MTKKLWNILALCVVFAIVLMFINGLVEQRILYHSSALLEGDGYRMIVRSLKYGMVLVVFVFAAFFLSELLQGWRIHPIQYLLVGSALSIFYLLLLSFAEHLGFESAYLLGAAACIGLLGWYCRYVLQNSGGGDFMAVLLSVSYGMMYILVSMQYNLVVGSCLLFAALFAVMYFTRHIDWYELGESKQQEKETERKYIVR